MSPLSVLRIALRALGRNRVRTFLTTLGVVIGVGSVIAMVSLGQGAQASVQREIQNMGTNILYLRPGSMKSFGAHMGAGEAWYLDDRKPHRAKNSGEEDRIHFVMDVESNPKLLALLGPSAPALKKELSTEEEVETMTPEGATA